MDFAPRWMVDGLVPAYLTDTASLRIGMTNPSLLADIDPAKVARASKAAAAVGKPLSDAIMSGFPNWCVAPCSSASWAKHVFPDLDPA
ncbi:aminopeptidase, partial [Acinetobacter baumannii]